MNPIYIEYYPHESCDCYKIDTPWSKYRKETNVLCPISKGLELAKLIAVGVINRHLASALTADVEEKGN